MSTSTITVGTRIRTRVADCDNDEHGDERAIPIGTLGTVLHVAEGEGELYDIAWDNGAWTCWSLDELREDADILPTP